MNKNGNRAEWNRRNFLGLCGKIALVGVMPGTGLANEIVKSVGLEIPARELKLFNTHTGERLACAYSENGQLVPDALVAINRLMRDHRTGEAETIDPKLLDLMNSLATRVESTEEIQIISGYRSPTTNKSLRKRSSGVAVRSYHLQGMAVDLRLPGVSTDKLHKAALAQRSGGVGKYSGSGFIHIDSGPTRTW